MFHIFQTKFSEKLSQKEKVGKLNQKKTLKRLIPEKTKPQQIRKTRASFSKNPSEAETEPATTEDDEVRK